MNVAAVDPGTTNIAAWVGNFDQENGRVTTIAMLHGVQAEPGAPKKAKKPVYAITADCAERVADICERANVAHIIVETAPQWNTPARISASAAYGVFRGRKLPVSFSSPSTKAKAMMMFAEKLGIVGNLEAIPPEWDRKDKVVSSKVRLINKRNAVRVVEALLKSSNDTVGLETFNSEAQKHDMADSLLLACGGVMTAKRKKAAPRKKAPAATPRKRAPATTPRKRARKAVSPVATPVIEQEPAGAADMDLDSDDSDTDTEIDQ